MAREFTVIIEQDEEGYLVGSVPELTGCHTQATSMDELLDRMKEAIKVYLEAQDRNGTEPMRLVGIQRLVL